MENQKISKRYIRLKDLNELLKLLFGSKYSLEVSQSAPTTPAIVAESKFAIGRWRELHLAGAKTVDRCYYLHLSGLFKAMRMKLTITRPKSRVSPSNLPLELLHQQPVAVLNS